MQSTKSKNQVFGYVRDRVKEGWKGNLLTQAGKEVLLRPVALAFPNYVHVLDCQKSWGKR